MRWLRWLVGCVAAAVWFGGIWLAVDHNASLVVTGLVAGGPVLALFGVVIVAVIVDRMKRPRPRQNLLDEPGRPVPAARTVPLRSAPPAPGAPTELLRPAPASPAAPTELLRPAPAAPTARPGAAMPGVDHADQPEWRVGDVLLDLYDVQEKLGEGGFGQVWRVRHREWNLDLAVKTPKPAVIVAAGGVADFVREAETWVGLGIHPHVVSCFYVRTLDDGVPRVFAEFVEGGSLAAWIRKDRALGQLYAGGPEQALARILDIAIQTAWGLEHAHEKGLVHQDFKPANVMMTLAGTAKVTDFGLARGGARSGGPRPHASGETVQATFVAGTSAYFSPEQATAAARRAAGMPAEKLTRRSDLWSWAVTVFEMLAGGVPTKLDGRPAGAGQIAGERFELFCRTETTDPRLPSMPEQLATLLRRCFAKKPEDRPHRMVEVAEGLIQLYREVAAQPYPRTQPREAELLADGWNNRAVSLLDLGRTQQAQQGFEEALAADPQHLHATYNRALLLWRSGRLTDGQAVEQVRESGADRSQDWQGWCFQAWLHVERGDDEGAREALAEASRWAAEHPWARQQIDAAERAIVPGSCGLGTFEGHHVGVTAVAMTPDGRLAVSGGADCRLRVWNLETGQCLRSLEGLTQSVTAVAMTPDGRLAVSGSHGEARAPGQERGERVDNRMWLWDLEHGRCLRMLEGHYDFVMAASMTPDGKLAASGSRDRTVRLWDLETGRCVRTLEGHDAAVAALAMTPDGKLAVSGGWEKTVRLWDLGTGRCLRMLEGHAESVSAVSMTPDGRLAVSGSHDRTIRLWDLGTGRCLRTLAGHASSVQALSMTPDGRLAISGGSDETVRLWDLGTGRCLRTLAGHTASVSAASMTPDGRLALTGSWDKTMRLWRLARGALAPMELVAPRREPYEERRRFDELVQSAKRALARGALSEAVALHEDARRMPGHERVAGVRDLASELSRRTSRGTFREAYSLRSLEGHTASVYAVSMTPDGRLALSGSWDHTLRLWDLGTGHCLRSFEAPRQCAASVTMMTPDGRLAVCAGYGTPMALDRRQDDGVWLWDLETGRCSHLLEQSEWLCAASMTPDGRFAISGGSDKTVRLWDLGTGRCLRTLHGHADAVSAVAVTPDARLAVSTSMDKTVRLWDLDRGCCVETLAGHAEGIKHAVCITPDGRRALAASAGDAACRLWDRRMGGSLRTLEGHQLGVTALSMTPDGRIALSGSDDTTVRLWDVANACCLRTLKGHSDAVQAVSITAHGRLAVSASADQTLRLWYLDWELEPTEPEDWDERARPFLAVFLRCHTPMGDDRVTRRGRPVWSENDFERLVQELQCAGLGWLRPEGVRLELRRMAEGSSP